MDVGLVGDIHGNKPALDAALERLESEGVDAVCCVGDIVGVLGWNREVVTTIRDRASVAVIGNHDVRVVPEGDYSPDSDYERIEHDMVTDQLTEDELAWLSSLPEKTRTGDITLVHSHPDEETRWSGDDRIPARDFVKMGAYTNGGILAFGHTHEQHAVDLDPFSGQSGLVINPGSVGVPYYESARCAVINTESQGFRLFEADYDEQQVVDRLQRLGVYDDLQSLARQRVPHNRRAVF